MKKILLICFVFSFLQSGYSQQITTANISFNFVAKNVEGSLADFSSTSKIDWDTPENSIIQGAVRTETLKTGNFLRDWSLKGSTYFNAKDFPTIDFKSTKVQFIEGTIVINGNLSLKGITKPIQITFLKEGNKLKGTTTLFASDFDITVLKKGRESNKVVVRFDLGLE